MRDRRQFLQGAACLASAGAIAGVGGLVPAWARTGAQGNLGLSTLTGNRFDLQVGKFAARIDGKVGEAVGVNGTLPAPLLRFREGEEVVINVKNSLKTETSIHWHGLLVPFHMDGVPGVSFPGIKPGETFQYRFSAPQNGTYWYHSHSGLQEQSGHYGPLIIDPKGADPVQYDREYVLVLSDWSFEDPHRIFAKLKKTSDVYSLNQPTLAEFMQEVSTNGMSAAVSSRAMWGKMRMSARDIADVTGATYTYLINGLASEDGWNGVFIPGERVRLRVINASAMTLFNVRIPGLPMTIVQADGQNIQPVEVDEFQIGVAETYDAIITPKDAGPYAFVAESIDRSGQAIAHFSANAGEAAPLPKLRAPPVLTMRDMGMAGMAEGMDHGTMQHGQMDHAGDGGSKSPTLNRGPGIANLVATPLSRLNEPGIGLENVPHRTLRYAQLRSLEPNTDKRPPGRQLTLHLTGNMERYMWSFDGVKFAHVKEAIKFYDGERLRLNLINETMMPHPIHLHGMFFELVNGAGAHQPRKHTIVVKPAEKLSLDITAGPVGDWAFHCHLLYHMHAGMMQVVSVLPSAAEKGAPVEVPHSMPAPMDHSKMDHGDAAK